MGVNMIVSIVFNIISIILAVMFVSQFNHVSGTELLNRMFWSVSGAASVWLGLYMSNKTW